MDKLLEQLFLFSQKLIKEALSEDERYRRLTTESAEIWEEFRGEFSKEASAAAVDLSDNELQAAAMEQEAAFLLGIQLGVSLGRIDLLSGQ